jgi:hypothetical protein
MGVIIFHPQQEYFLFDECQEAEKKELHKHIMPTNASYIPIFIPTHVKIIPINWKKF